MKRKRKNRPNGSRTDEKSAAQFHIRAVPAVTTRPDPLTRDSPRLPPINTVTTEPADGQYRYRRLDLFTLLEMDFWDVFLPRRGVSGCVIPLVDSLLSRS